MLLPEARIYLSFMPLQHLLTLLKRRTNICELLSLIRYHSQILRSLIFYPLKFNLYLMFPNLYRMCLKL